LFFYTGCRCPVCDQPFNENDDIVACPQCGAPHHRDCWMQEGHCHFEHRHAEGFRWEREPEPAVNTATPDYMAEDTDEEVSGDDAYRTAPPPGARSTHCPRCGFPSPAYADYCSRCGTPLKSRSNPYQHTGYGEYAPFHATPADPCGGVDPKEEIQGVPVEELASCVRMNSAYYMPRFVRMAREGGNGWNWAAFVAGPYWLLFRKCYLFGGVALALLAACRILYMAVTITVLLPVVEGADTYAEIFNALLEGISNGALPTSVVGLVNLINLVQILLHVLCGLLGNRLYLRTCVARVKRLREQNPYGYRVFLPQNGGVSLFLGVLGYSAITLLQNVLQYFFMV